MLLELLDGISPFHWITLAVILGVLVMVVSVDMLLWPALASLFIGLILFIFPDLPGQYQVLLFAVLSISAVVLVRYWMPKLGDGGPVSASLNDPLTRLVGQVGKVSEVNGKHGKIVIDGVNWEIQHEDGELSLDVMVKVVGHKGSVLIVKDC